MNNIHATTVAARPAVNPCECSGCQACVEICPELFAWDDGSQCVVVRRELAPMEAIERAMAYCPNDCIEADPA